MKKLGLLLRRKKSANFDENQIEYHLFDFSDYQDSIETLLEETKLVFSEKLQFELREKMKSYSNLLKFWAIIFLMQE